MDFETKEAIASGRYVDFLLRRFDFWLSGKLKRFVVKGAVVEDNKIFFMTFDDKFSCNPAFIANELARCKAPVRMVWCVPESGIYDPREYPEGTEFVRRNSYEMCMAMATSKVWVDNALSCVWYNVPKKQNQYYINTWHGSMGIKKISGTRHWTNIAKRLKKRTDYVVANSKFEEDVYQSLFGSRPQVLKYGHPRNDIFFNEEMRYKAANKVRKYFNISKNEKVFLYAPTFRDDKNMNFMTLDFERIHKALGERFGGQWCILVRFHFKNASAVGTLPLNEHIKNASGYPNMNEILCATDIGCTDYSSWAYDYMLLKRPVFIFAPDVDSYGSSRGFYYSVTSTPFGVGRTTEELISKINEYDEETYQRDCGRFLKEKGCYEKGTASKLTVDKIAELMHLDMPDMPEEIEAVSSDETMFFYNVEIHYNSQPGTEEHVTEMIADGRLPGKIKRTGSGAFEYFEIADITENQSYSVKECYFQKGKCIFEGWNARFRNDFNIWFYLCEDGMWRTAKEISNSGHTKYVYHPGDPVGNEWMIAKTIVLLAVWKDSEI